MTKEEIIKKAYGFRGANREFSQEMGPLVESILEHAGAEVEDSLESSSSTKALSARMGKELNVTKQDAPETAGSPGQVLQLDENGDPQWVDAAEGGTYDAAMSQSSTNAVQNKVIVEELSKYAKKTGSYEGFFADNLIGDKTKITTGYTLKATGYDPQQPELEFADGPDFLTELKGRAVAWNQLVSDDYINFVNTNPDTAASLELRFQWYNGNTLISYDSISSSVGIKGSILTSPNDANRVIFKHYGALHDFTICVITGSIVANHKYLLHNNNVSVDISTVGGTVINGINLIDITLLCPHLASKANLTVAEVEEYLATLHTEKPYWPYNDGQLLGSRMLGWDLRSTKNLLNPDTKKAKLFEYAYTGHDNEYTVIGFDGLTGAALQFTPYKTGVAEAVTLDANDRFVIPGAGELEVVNAVSGTDFTGDIHQVCVLATYDGSEDEGVVGFSENSHPFDSANIYHKSGDTYTQVFDGGVMKATGDGANAVRDEIGYDEVTGKCFTKNFVGEVDLGILTWSVTEAGNMTSLPITMKYSAETINEKYPVGNSSTDKSSWTSGVYFYIRDTDYSDAATFKTAMDGVMLYYELATPTIYTSDLYYKTGEDTYVPLEEVWPMNGLCCNWASENLVEQALDANGQPQSITPMTTEVFQSDMKELLKTIADTYISKNSLEQTTGESTEVPMSQKAVTDAVSALDTRTSNLETLTEQLAAEDLSFRDVNNNISHLRNTANCYVVKSTGAFKLPLVYGNAIKDGEVNAAAYTNGGGENQAPFVNHLGNAITSPYIEEHAGCQAASAIVLWQEVSGMIQNPRLVLGEGEGVRDLLFDVKSCPSTGANAVVGILDADNNVIWSWHIWVYPDKLGTTEITNHTEEVYEMLDVALGTSYDDAQKTRFKNVHYQWGRKDPMLSPAAYNSTSNHAQYGDKQFAVAEGPAADVATAIKNPNKFFLYDSDNNNDWQSDEAKRFNHWDAACTAAGASDNEVVKTVYDPSPVGFKVPNGRVFTGFTTTGGNTSTAEEFNVVGSFSAGWKFKANDEDTDGQFFPASGSRSYSSGGLSSVSSGGNYWSSAAYSATGAYYLGFYSSYVNPLNNSSRANGFSVRPVRE